jgi:hypothetical protein
MTGVPRDASYVTNPFRSDRHQKTIRSGFALCSCSCLWSPAHWVLIDRAEGCRGAANTLLHSDSYLGARFRSLRTRRGAPKAIKAMARYLACIIYRVFTRGQAFVDRGAQEYENRRAQRELAALQFKAAAHGSGLLTFRTLRDAFPVQEFPANSEQFMERSNLFLTP